MNTHINDLQEQLARVCAERDAMREALTTISLVGGNMPDTAFETKTGPNDAMMRGGMFVTCRAIARAALGDS